MIQFLTCVALIDLQSIIVGRKHRCHEASIWTLLQQIIPQISQCRTALIPNHDSSVISDQHIECVQLVLVELLNEDIHDIRL